MQPVTLRLANSGDAFDLARHRRGGRRPLPAHRGPVRAAASPRPPPPRHGRGAPPPPGPPATGGGDGVSGRVEIRRELRPGDLGEIVAFHGRIYAAEYGVDRRFEGFVAAAIAEAGKRGFPGEREAVWIVERDGAMAGCLALAEDP